ncbi:fluoride efflux transporter FluC [Helicobacter kayseriensis]|uniref:fluoride efflux transporter FluC n=1 Tax=Helicobacter kayseriensis TaxID=2905877 RepID=UPI003D1611EF
MLFVGPRSFLGGILRFMSFSHLPFGSLGNLFWINLIGNFGIGILSEVLITQEMRLMFIVGFLGSLTTFSTFNYELFQMFSYRKDILCHGILASKYSFRSFGSLVRSPFRQAPLTYWVLLFFLSILLRLT